MAHELNDLKFRIREIESNDLNFGKRDIERLQEKISLLCTQLISERERKETIMKEINGTIDINYAHNVWLLL